MTATADDIGRAHHDMLAGGARIFGNGLGHREFADRRAVGAIMGSVLDGRVVVAEHRDAGGARGLRKAGARGGDFVPPRGDLGAVPHHLAEPGELHHQPRQGGAELVVEVAPDPGPLLLARSDQLVTTPLTGEIQGLPSSSGSWKPVQGLPPKEQL